MAVVKIYTRKNQSYQQLIEYIYKDDEFIDHQMWFEIRHNVRGESFEDMSQEFIENEKGRLRRRKDSTTIYHDIVSFHEESSKKMTKHMLVELGNQYCRLRNRNGQAKIIAVPHFDTDETHLHVMVSGVGQDGKSMRLSKTELRKLQVGFQEFHRRRFPELDHSTVRFEYDGQKKNREVEHWSALRGTESVKSCLKKKIQEIYSNARDEEHFIELVFRDGYKTYSRGGKAYGVVFEGRKHRFKSLLKSEWNPKRQFVPELNWPARL